ncbi:MAG: VCBS repeat-containing protein [Bacteroidetes bacterium]|nr:VCBS repeat-containing protein [Bacteroidota bacterium]
MINFRIALIGCFVFLQVHINAQPVAMFRDTSIAVFHNTNRLENAWAGGMNTPVFGTMDLNGDGKMDLIEFDAPSLRVNTFINLGIANMSSYKYAPEYARVFPKDLEGWIRTFDYDFDGDMDLFSYAGGAISLFRNDYTPGTGLTFTPITYQMGTHYGGFSTNIYASRVNAPALTDLDNDGDMDVLAFSISGSWVECHKSYSMDSLGVPGQLLHYNIPVCWGYFVLANNTNTAVLPPVLPTCPLWVANPSARTPFDEAAEPGSGPLSLATRQQRHAGSTLLALDMNGDGDKDILNGDILGNNLLYIENCGTPDSAWVCAQDTAFPSYDIPANLNDVAGPHYFDANNDGSNDLIVSNFFFTGEDYYNVKYYRNTTNNQSNVFAYVKNRWLVDGMIEVGTGAHPVFFDVDQDGKKDLLVGNDFYYNNNSPVGKIAYYRNTGTGTKAEYTLVTDDFSGVSATGLLGIYPAFGDLDGDGDADMLLGESDGNLVYYQNIAGTGNPCIFILTQLNYQSINIGDNAAPQLVDVDRDGDLDLLIGERAGTLNYYKNTGSPTVPVFSLETSSFGGLNVTKWNSFAGFSAPVLFDNGSGYELIVGSMSGYLYHYNNIDGNLAGNFNLVDSMFQNIFEPQVAVPAMADVDSDGKYDLAVGSLAGGIVLYTQDATLSIAQPASSGAFFTLYPNPTEQLLNIALSPSADHRLLIRFFDVRGELIYQREAIHSNITVDF